jgi:very-short-patch-repair endonuclease
VHVHHSTILESTDVARQEGIPVTAVPRTLLDLADQAHRRVLEQSVERSQRLGLLDLAKCDALLARSGGHAGKERLRHALALYRDPAFTRSWPERKFLELVRGAGLPRPATNTYVAGFELDAYWAAERFAVEIDGFQTHGTRAAFESDRLRQEDLKLVGIDSIRITARRIEREPDRVAARLQTLLAKRRRELRLHD